MPDVHKIQVHDKVLAHLSKGLYRSPASALRELVSNAWDANAATVRIDTNYPHFLQITVEDDGDGFDLDTFITHMEGNVGNSLKREQQEENRLGRPVVGRLGIGLLGIAQICGGFRIASRPREGKPFQARVVLEDNLKARLDNPDSELRETADTFDIGTFYIEEPTIPITGQGTVVIADDVHPTFAHTFQSSLTYDKYEEPPLSWERCVDHLKSIRTLQELGDYWRLLWELAASCPVPYLSDEALPDGLIKDDHRRLLSYGFRVFVDGRQIFKPVKLKGNKEGYTTQTVDFEKQVYTNHVKVHGYIAVQEGLQIKPDELRGILIRIKNIGIGYYDPSLLDYRINEGPRNRWITGELYVDQGLEDALNIDRDSFNRFDPEYRSMQVHVHQLLQTDVFSRVYKNIDKRSKVRNEEKQQKQTQALTATLSEFRTRNETPSKSTDVRTPSESPTQQIETRQPDDLPTKRANRTLASAILAIFETAMQEPTDAGRRDAFERLLIRLLKEW